MFLVIPMLHFDIIFLKNDLFCPLFSCLFQFQKMIPTKGCHRNVTCQSLSLSKKFLHFSHIFLLPVFTWKRKEKILTGYFVLNLECQIRISKRLAYRNYIVTNPLWFHCVKLFFQMICKHIALWDKELIRRSNFGELKGQTKELRISAVFWGSR